MRKKEVNIEIKDLRLKFSSKKPQKSSNYNTSLSEARRLYGTSRTYQSVKRSKEVSRSLYSSDMDKYKRNLESGLSPLENEKVRIEKSIAQIESEILLIESWLAKNS